MESEGIKFHDTLPRKSVKGVIKESFRCQICHEQYATKSNLKRHYKKHNDNNKFVCRKCTQYFSSQEELTAHETAKHSFKHLCTSCGKTFSKKAHLQVHQSRLHEHGSSEYNHPCPFENCNKTFYQKQRLQDHINYHTGTKPFSCAHCLREFHGMYLKNKHEKTCMADTKVMCNICGRLLCDIMSLKRHKDAQHNQTRHTCQCGKMFRYQTSLIKHQKIKGH